MSPYSGDMSGRTIYANPWIRLTEDEVPQPDGTTAPYAVLHAPDFVVVLPFDGERFHLVEQYRHPVGRRLWEFPQGSVTEPAGLAPEAVAWIELAEESGLSAGRLDLLGYLHESTGRSTNGFHAFLATDLTPVTAHRDPQEADMRTGAFTLDEVWRLIDEGALTDASSVAALALLARWESLPPRPADR